MLTNAFTFPKKFFNTSILTNLTGITYLSADIVLAKHFLTPTAAGQYSFISLVGKMVFLLSTVFSQFIIPVVSRDIGAGNKSNKSYTILLTLIIGANVIAFLGFGVFGYITVPILWGAKAASIVSYLPLYAFAMVNFSLAATISSYHQIKDEHAFPIAGFFLGFIEIIGILLFHGTIQNFIDVVVFSGVVSLVAMIVLDRFYKNFQYFYNNLVDFVGLFGRLPEIAVLPSGKFRILIFNWRDLKHKWAGGAEVYIHELAKRWVRMGHEVTLFCGNDGHSSGYETVDGVRIIRRGGRYFVYVWAFVYYQFRLHKKYDIVIDSENGIPFFSPLYTKKKTFLLIHHVHQEVFRRSLKPPLSWIGLFLERRLMPLVYKNTEVITVSPSSKADILDHKLTLKEPSVLYNGVDLNVCKPGKKSPSPMVLYLGRLTNLKSIPVFIHAAERILSDLPTVKFVIAGDGPDRTNLMKLVKKLGLEHAISFKGRVSEGEKVALYQRAWVFVNPSLIEGWGITTIEANACGTPVVASNVQGLQDAVHNPHSGFLVPYGNIEAFSDSIKKLLTDERLRQQMSHESIEWAKQFDWEKSANEGIQIII